MHSEVNNKVVYNSNYPKCAMLNSLVMSQDTYCPVYEAINLLQEKWTLHIVRVLLKEPLGFNELSRAVGGVNSNTLAQRLEHLDELGVVEKTIISMMPPKTSYSLTEAGVELNEAVDAIARWGAKHMSLESDSPKETCV